MGVKSHFLFSLSSHSKQAGDTRYLPQDISFFHATHLPFPDHVHDLISLQGSPRALPRKEAHPRLDQPFDKAVVLFDQVVEVFHLPQFYAFRQNSSRFEVCNGFGVGSVLIDIYNTWGWFGYFLCLLLERFSCRLLTCTGLRSRTAGRLQGFAEKAFGGLGIPRRAQEKLERVPVGIDRSVEIRPGFSDFYIGLIYAPGVVGGFEVRSASFFQFRCIALD
jgi:hypothetical protein